jgi:hypothetical protein
MAVTITEVLNKFVAEHRDMRDIRTITDMLRASLDGYAYQWLDDDERERWEATWADPEDPTDYCDVFGPDKIIPNLPEFLGYFMVRKVLADAELLESAGRVTASLLDWLAEEAYIPQDDVDMVRELAERAAVDLPAAERLSTLLFRESRQPPTGPVLEERELDDAVIAQVEPGALWFSEPDGVPVGPVFVEEEAITLAREEWGVSGLVLERTPAGWRISEVGSVFPL